MDDGVGKPERVIRPDGMEKGLLAKGGEPEPEEQRSREPSCTDGKQSAFRRQPLVCAGPAGDAREMPGKSTSGTTKKVAFPLEIVEKPRG